MKTTRFTRRIQKIKDQIQAIGPMRPGTLTCQYRDPKRKIGPFWQLSYTHRMKSRTEYVRRPFIPRIRREIASFKRFKSLTAKWVALALRRSQLEIGVAKKSADK